MHALLRFEYLPSSLLIGTPASRKSKICKIASVESTVAISNPSSTEELVMPLRLPALRLRVLCGRATESSRLHSALPDFLWDKLSLGLFLPLLFGEGDWFKLLDFLDIDLDMV